MFNDSTLAAIRKLKDGQGNYLWQAGDIVNGQPVYVKAPFARYQDAGYQAFKTANAARTAMLYVPSNDGMLHAFYAQTDTVGNMVVPEDRIRSAMEEAGSDAFELHRELRLALGQAWDDELEAFRHASQDSAVVWLHKVG